jgi:hypothetical protein
MRHRLLMSSASICGRQGVQARGADVLPEGADAAAAPRSIGSCRVELPAPRLRAVPRVRAYSGPVEADSPNLPCTHSQRWGSHAMLRTLRRWMLKRANRFARLSSGRQSDSLQGRALHRSQRPEAPPMHDQRHVHPTDQQDRRGPHPRG